MRALLLGLMLCLPVAASWAWPQAAGSPKPPPPPPSKEKTAAPPATQPPEEKPLFSDDGAEAKQKQDAEAMGFSGVPQPSTAPAPPAPPAPPRKKTKAKGKPVTPQQQLFADQQAALRARQKAQAAALGFEGAKKPAAAAESAPAKQRPRKTRPKPPAKAAPAPAKPTPPKTPPPKPTTGEEQ